MHNFQALKSTSCNIFQFLSLQTFKQSIFEFKSYLDLSNYIFYIFWSNVYNFRSGHSSYIFFKYFNRVVTRVHYQITFFLYIWKILSLFEQKSLVRSAVRKVTLCKKVWFSPIKKLIIGISRGQYSGADVRPKTELREQNVILLWLNLYVLISLFVIIIVSFYIFDWLFKILID